MERLTKRIILGREVPTAALCNAPSEVCEGAKSCGSCVFLRDKIFQRLAAYEDTNHTPEECAAAFEELAAYRAADIWKIVCFMIARNNIIGSAPKERVDVMALMTIKTMPDMLQMEECRKLLAAAEAALKEQEANQ